MKAALLTCLGILAATATLATASPPPTTFIVSPGESIQDAVDTASSGDTIVLRRGSYREQVFIGKQLTIDGSKRLAVWVGTEDDSGGAWFAPQVTIGEGVEGVVLKDIAFRFAQEDDAVQSDGVCRGVQISGCSFTGCRNNAIELNECDGTEVSDCIFRSNSGDFEGDGNWDWDGIGPELSNNKHTRTSGAAVTGDDGIAVDLCTFDKCSDLAVLRNDDWGFGMVDISGCTFKRGFAGVRLDDTDGASVSDCRGQSLRGSFLDIDADDVSVDGDNKANVCGDAGLWMAGEDNSVSDFTATHCGVGLDVRGLSVEVLDNKTTDCDDGICVDGRDEDCASGGEVADNTVKSCTGAGIEVVRCGQVDIHDNKVTDVGGADLDDEGDFPSGGIAVVACDDATLDNNTVGDVDGGAGILVVYSQNVDVTDNKVKDTLSGGILLLGDNGYYNGDSNYCYYSYGEYKGAQDIYNYYYSYEYSPGYSHYVAGNTVTDCGGRDDGGIHLRRQVYCNVVYNTVISSAGAGVLGYRIDGCAIYGNAISRPDRDGIWLQSYYSYTGYANLVELNTVSTPGAEGIQNSIYRYGYGEVIRNNLVTRPGELPFANEGKVDKDDSNGNFPFVIGDAWDNVPVREGSWFDL